MGMERRLARLGALLLLLLLAIAAPGWGYPRTAEPAFGLRQLREHQTSEDGRRMTLDFAHDDPDVAGRRIEVNYDVELAPHIRLRNTDDEEHLLAVEGSADGTMRLTFDSAEAAAAFANDLTEVDLLHGHYQDGPGEAAAVYPFHARVLTSKLAQETLDLDIDIPTLTEVFINAMASIYVAPAPEDHYLVYHRGDEPEGAAQAAQEESAPVPSPTERRQPALAHRRLNSANWLKNWTTRYLQRIKELGGVVLQALDVAAQLVQFAFTGNLDTGDRADVKIELFDFNYNKATNGPICGFNLESNIVDTGSTPPFWGECRNCYAYASVGLRLDIDIEKYDVQKFVAMVDGALDLNMYMEELSVPSFGVNGTYEKLIKQIVSKIPAFTLGPIVVDLTVRTPVRVGVDMWLNGAGAFSMDMTATANIKAGYRYVKTATPDRQVVNKVDYNFGGKGVRLLRWAGREIGMRFFLLPVVQLDIALGSGPFNGLAHIGGPNFGLEASVQASVTASNSTHAQVTRACGVEGTIGANVTLKIGTDKSKDLLRGKGHMEPQGIFSKDFPMGVDHVRFVKFAVPTPPRRLYLPWDYSSAMDDDYGMHDEPYVHPSEQFASTPTTQSPTMRVVQPSEYIEAPEPVYIPNPSPHPPPIPYDWGQPGTIFHGSLERLKSEDAPGCSAEEMGGYLPPYLDITAVVLHGFVIGYYSNPNEFMMDLAFSFSYGKTEPSDADDIGAFAAISQGAYTISYRNAYRLGLPQGVNVPCSSSMNTDLAPAASKYPDISYIGNTTAEPITLPRMAGAVCGGGNTIYIGDTKGCYRIMLSRNPKNATMTTTSTTRRHLDTLPNEERRRKLGHMDRFPRVSQQCAPPKPPTHSPTRPPTTRPSPTMGPTLSPSQRPTRSPTTAPPSTAPTRAPSSTPTQAPSTAPTPNPTTPPPSRAPTASTLSPTRTPTAPPPSQSPTGATPAPTKTITTAPSPAPSAAAAVVVAAAVAGVAATSPSTTTSTGTSPATGAQQLTTLADTTTGRPTSALTDQPSARPTSSPSPAPTKAPSTTPTDGPTTDPTSSPTARLSTAPTEAPTAAATEAPSPAPSAATLSSTSTDTTAAAAITEHIDATDANPSTGGDDGGSDSSVLAETLDEESNMDAEAESLSDLFEDDVGGDHGHAGGSDIIPEPESRDDGALEPMGAQDVEITFEEKVTQAPTPEQSVDDDIEDQDQDKDDPPMVKSDADGSAKHPAWLHYAVGLGAVIFSSFVSYKCLRRCLCKKWNAAIAERNQNAAPAVPV